FLPAEQGWVSIYISRAQPVLAVVFDFGFKNSPSRWERVRVREPRMNHKVILFLFTASALICSNLAGAQQPKKISQIGYLVPDDAASDSSRAEGIRLALRERGYIEGQNIAIEYRYAEGKNDRYHELAAELVRLKVDIIVVSGGDPLIRAAKN